MNRSLLVLNIVLLLAVGGLFFLFFTRDSKAGEYIIRHPGVDTAGDWQHTPVAYFEMDSIEANFIEFRKMQDEVLKREQIKNDSINILKQIFQNYVLQVQPLFQKMNPAEKDSLNSVVMVLDNDTKNKIADLNQRYETYYFSRKTELVTQIKNFCKEFNKDRRYSYIIANEPLFYYADTTYNITRELLKGLNDYYSKKKKN